MGKLTVSTLQSFTIVWCVCVCLSTRILLMQTLKTPLSHHLHHSQRSHHHQQLHYWEEMCFAGSNNIKEALVCSQLLTIVEKTTAEQSCFAFANELSSHNLLAIKIHQIQLDPTLCIKSSIKIFTFKRLIFQLISTSTNERIYSTIHMVKVRFIGTE